MNRRYSKTENDWYMNKCFQIFGRDEQVKKMDQWNQVRNNVREKSILLLL